MILWIILLIIFALLLLFYKKNGSIWKGIVFTGVTGLASLFAIGFMTSDWLYFNAFTFCTVIVTGIPGAITTVILNTLLV